MKAINFILIGVAIIISLSSCNKKGQIFSDETYQDTIKQNVGGAIIRNIHYYNDFQSFDYKVSYTYKDKYGSISKIGSSHYYCKRPPVDEQLIQYYNKWLIFKTSGYRDKDFVFICDSNTLVWRKYEMSCSEIESTDLWINQRIESELGNWDNVVKVENIDENGNITVLYVFRKKNGKFPFFRDKRKITYKINKKTGVPEMTTISKI